jgi:hypothetical protein
VLLREQSQSTDAEGRTLELLRVDHVRGEGSCTSPAGETARVPLPPDAVYCPHWTQCSRPGPE